VLVEEGDSPFKQQSLALPIESMRHAAVTEAFDWLVERGEPLAQVLRPNGRYRFVEFAVVQADRRLNPIEVVNR
jgi:hypothetical protein